MKPKYECQRSYSPQQYCGLLSSQQSESILWMVTVWNLNLSNSFPYTQKNPSYNTLSGLWDNYRFWFKLEVSKVDYF